MAAGESGVYSTVLAGIGAGGRPLGADGLQTFGGVRALARYVKIEAVPASGGGSIVVNEASLAVRARGGTASNVCVKVPRKLITSVPQSHRSNRFSFVLHTAPTSIGGFRAFDTIRELRRWVVERASFVHDIFRVS